MDLDFALNYYMLVFAAFWSLTVPAGFGAWSFIEFGFTVYKTTFIPMEFLSFGILSFHCHVRPYPGCREPQIEYRGFRPGLKGA